MKQNFFNILTAILALKTFTFIRAATIEVRPEVAVESESTNDELISLLKLVSIELSQIDKYPELNIEEMQNKVIEKLRLSIGKPRSPRQDDGDGDVDAEGAVEGASAAASAVGGLPGTVEGFLLSGITGSIFANLIPGDVGNTIKNIYAPINNFVEPFLKSLIGNPPPGRNGTTIRATTARAIEREDSEEREKRLYV